MMAASYAGSGRPRSTGRLDGARLTRDCARKLLEGGPMGWWAIVLIGLFVVGIAVLNRVEFGSFD
jgi:hypothetical protein